MKTALITFSLMVLSTVANAKTVTAPIYLRYDGLYPADFEVHYFVTILETQEGALKQIAKICGSKPQVTDLKLQSELIHNSLPGTASVVVKGKATCVVPSPRF